MFVYAVRKKQTIQAGLFSLFLLGFFAVSLGTAFMSAGPFILGTEMNANGSVEYLCLGRTCETYRHMDW